MKINVSLLQISPKYKLEENLQKGISACLYAKNQGADIILFPEMWSNGYNIYNRPTDEWLSEAIESDSKYIITFQELAQKLNVAIAITFLEKSVSGPKNSVIIFDCYGDKVLHYSKVHTCIFSEEKELIAGDDFYVANLKTPKGNLMVGTMICYDREFPESARILMLKGAELILVPNACPMEINRLAQLRGRAYENMVAIATCNYPQTVPDCNGNSSIYDGVAYLPELTGSRDMCLFLDGNDENISTTTIDIDMIRKYREVEVHGNAYRKPSKYKLIIDEQKSYPFIRNHK